MDTLRDSCRQPLANLMTTMPSSSRGSQAMSSPRLLDRVRAEIRIRHYSRRTEQTYVHWIRRFIVFHDKKHPSTMGAPEISAYLAWLATDRQVAASTQNQALSAVLFLYRDVMRLDVGDIEQVARARGPMRVPVVLSADATFSGCRWRASRKQDWWAKWSLCGGFEC